MAWDKSMAEAPSRRLSGSTIQRGGLESSGHRAPNSRKGEEKERTNNSSKEVGRGRSGPSRASSPTQNGRARAGKSRIGRGRTGGSNLREEKRPKEERAPKEEKAIRATKEARQGKARTRRRIESAPQRRES